MGDNKLLQEIPDELADINICLEHMERYPHTYRHARANDINLLRQRIVTLERQVKQLQLVR